MTRTAGIVATLFYAIHAAYHVAEGHPEDALWACHLATLLVAAGLLLRRPLPAAIGVAWLALGIPLWIADLAGGGAFLPTSLLTHVGGLVLGLHGLSRMGVPAKLWWKALLSLWGLQLVTRAVTPPAANVNLAFRVWDGYERTFPSYRLYLALLWLVAGSTFLMAELGLRRLWPAPR